MFQAYIVTAVFLPSVNDEKENLTPYSNVSYEPGEYQKATAIPPAASVSLWWWMDQSR